MRRNAIFLTALMILMSLAPMVQASEGRSTTCTGSVCINELMPNPAGSDTGSYPAGEWVELYNAGPGDVNLQGWTLDDPSWSHPIDSNSWVDFSNLTAPYVLVAGDYAIIAENNQGTLKINNAGETLQLVNGAGTAIHTVTTGQANSDISKIPGASATDDYVDSASNTPGGPNGGAGTGPTYVQSELRIMEVMPDTYWTADNDTWPGGEWVEIANVGQAAVDLAGWTLEDAAGNSMAMNVTHLVDFSSGTIIQPGQHRLVVVNGSRTYGLLNNGAGTEQIKLKLPGGDITHQVEYVGPSRAGHSYVNATGGIPDWGRNANPLVTSMWPTPAALNPSGVIQPDVWQINEVLANQTQNEWIEIHLPEGMDIDLSFYSIRSGTGIEIPFDCTTLVDCSTLSLSAGEFRLLEMSDLLLDTYDSLSLVDGNGDVRQYVEWHAPLTENTSIIPSDHQMLSAPWMMSPYNTPGAANPGQETGGTSGDVDLRISELLPNPAGADTQTGMDGEWVEITNIGNDSVDLAGWELRTSSGFSLPPTMIEPGAFLVFPLGDESLSLTNAQGTLKLNDPQGESTHTVIWDYSAYGLSMVAGLSDAEPWVVAPWPTPGVANTIFEQPYSGPTDVLISEASPQCSNPEDGLTNEWIELYNSAGYPVNLSRWMVTDVGGGAVAVAPGRLWNHTANSMILEADSYVVLNIDDNLLTNSGETLTLLDPNRQMIQTLSWGSSFDCITLEPNGVGVGTRSTLWPTPGAENPAIQPYDGAMTLKFTRFMPGEVTNRNNDWFEIANTGETWIDLGGWVIARQRTNGAWNSTFSNTVLQPGDNLVFSPDPVNLSADGGPEAVDADIVFDGNAPWLVNSGGALQLVAPEGTVVDAFVYGSADADIEGWSGIALELPPSDFSGLIMMRGDGCGTLPDTDSSADWEVRWLRLGSSLFCDDGIFTATGSLTPVNSPVGSLAQMVDWIDGATTSFHLHVYQFSSPELFAAIEAAVGRGVDCTILLEGGILGDASDGANQRGWADELSNAGCTVLWMVEPSGVDAPMAPFRYIHSKVAVRDGDSVWIGSGNWKRSTFPLDGDAANRDSGIIIDSTEIADLVLSRMLWDENTSLRHIQSTDDAPTSMGRPAGWIPTSASTVFGPAEPAPPTFTGDFSGRLLTCPDDCIEGLVWLIDQADERIDLSLQYFDLGWHWGYGDNPLVQATERAADERGVKVRLLINGYYVNEDDDIRQTVNQFNHRMNMTDGMDVEARLMAPSDDILKLHDKAVIIDGRLSLFSSINWGSNSALRNRGMGIVIDHVGLAQYQQGIYDADWERMDDDTDSDGDGMPDRWEVDNGLNRTWSAVLGTTESEQNLDPDGDGLSNLLEFQNGGDPHLADTDGDCIDDGDEVVWAWANGIPASLAIQTADADLDGEPDNATLPCSQTGTTTEEPPEEEEDPDGDETSGPFRDDPLATTGAKILLAMVILAAVSLAGALGMLLMSRRRTSAGNVLIDDSVDISDAAWQDEEEDEVAPTGTVILDGTSVGPNASSDAREVSVGRDDGIYGAPQMDGYDFPGWSPKQVQDALAEGLTVEQLKEKYESEQ